MNVRTSLRLLQISKRGRRYLLLVVSLSIIQALVIVAQALLLSHLISDLLELNPSLDARMPELLLLGSIFIARSLLSYFGESYISRLGLEIRTETRSSLLDRVAKDDSVLVRDRDPEAMSRLVTQGIAELEPFFDRTLPELLRATAIPLTLVAVIVIQDLRGGLLISLAVLAMSFTAVAASRRALRSDSDGTSSHRGNFALLPSFIFELIGALTFSLLVIALAEWTLDGSTTLIASMVVLILTPQVYFQIRCALSQSQFFKRAIESATSILEIMDTSLKATAIDDGEGESASLGRIKEIRWTDGEVVYPDDCSVTFRWGIASSGKMTVITGPTGSGKTTLLNSLIRVNQLSEGRIFVETSKGTFRIEELGLDHWLNQISWISDAPHFVTGTIEENLKMIKPRANRQRLSEILYQAHLPVELLPAGLQTRIDQLDQDPSSGHLRRLALARAILKDALIIICDDPANSIDLDLERLIQGKLKELSREGKLVITVSNDDEVIGMADRRMVLDSERIEPLRMLEAAR